MSALLKSVPPRRTEARERLAEAIEQHTTAATHLERLKAAFERASGSFHGDDGAIAVAERAETALVEAKANEGQYLAAVAMGELTADENPIKIAERAVAEAEARLDTARKTQNALKEQMKATERDLDYANGALDKAVRRVLREEAGNLIDATLREAELLKEQLGAKRVLLSFLSGACFEWDEKEAQRPVADFMAAPAYPFEFNGRMDQHSALAPWHEAREALRQDADAPLPI